MATAIAHGDMLFANGARASRTDFDDGTVAWVVTPANGGALPPGYQPGNAGAFPNAALNPAQQ
jgi:hypothetical protein